MQKEIRVKLSGMSHDGRAVGRLDESCGDLAGLTVFVENAVLGQEVNALVLNRKKNFLEAKCLQVLKQSPYYEESLCPHSGECGGCTWRNIRYSAQADEKQKFLLNSLVRLGKFDRKAVEEKMFPLLSPLDLPEKNTDFYRNKMEFAFGFEDNVLKLGLKKKNSHKIIEVTDCRLQNPTAMGILKILRHTLKDFQGSFFRYAVLRFFGDKRTVELITYPFSQKNRLNEQNAVKNCRQALSSVVSGLIHSERRDKADIAYGERVIAEYGDTALSETLRTENGCFAYSLGNTAFFQVNSKMTEVLYSVVGSFAGLVLPETNGHVWDFYCGIGSISLTLAPLCLENRRNVIMPRYKNINAAPCAVRYKKPFLLGVELVGSAVALAKKNAELNSCSFARFECAEAKKLAQYFKRFSLPHLLVFDPPRAGMDEETVRAVLEHRPPFLILVSCNAATLARDLQKLCTAYRIEAIQGVDLFPHTPHVETVVLLSQQKPDDTIEIDLDLDELDATAAETKATYEEIKAYVWDKHHLKVSSLYISQIKRKCGLEVGQNYNLSKSENPKVPKCPPEKEAAIMDALKHFQMI